MKGLAEFVMRGRTQALLVAVACTMSLILSWIGAAVVALVTLRKGAGEGIWLLLWTLLPALAIAWYWGDGTYAALLVSTAVLALVLRLTVSLPLALLASCGAGLVTGCLLLVFGEVYLELVEVNFVEPYLQQREAALAAVGREVTLPRPETAAIAGAMGTGTAVMSVLCLLLARYWQARLYNPGGFGEEFRQLRYPVGVSLALVLATLGLSSIGVTTAVWSVIVLVPLVFAGVGLVHARAHQRNWDTGVLVLFYGAWLLLPMQLVMVFLAIADSWLDFRQRWKE